MINIMKKRKIWFAISGVLVALSLASIVLWGLNFGIDFTGGTLMQLSFEKDTPKIEDIANLLNTSTIIDNVTAQSFGEKNIILRFSNIDEETHQKVITVLKNNYSENFTEEKFNSIGPNIGDELKRKTVLAVILAIIAIIFYIAWAFRQVSKPVSSWVYGLIANVALLHNIIITIGAFSMMGKLYNMQINAPFIAAILTILGYSVNDTIVIFDRIRENLKKHYSGNLEETINTSINQSITRSVNISFNVILALFAILIFGGNTIRDFALALIIGLAVGTYSSIFLASPLLIEADNWMKKRKK